LDTKSTKLKGWTNLSAVKILSFIVIIGMLVQSFISAINILEKDVESGVSFAAAFSSVDVTQSLFDSVIEQANEHAGIILMLQSEESIRAGEGITWAVAPYWSDEPFLSFDEFGRATIYRLYNRQHLINNNPLNHPLAWEAIDSQLRMFAFAQNWLEHAEGILFYLRDGDFVHTNVPRAQQNHEFFAGKQIFYIDGNDRRATSHGRRRILDVLPYGTTDTEIMIALTDEVVNAHTARFAEARNLYRANMAIIGVSALVALGAFVIFLLGAGRKRKAAGVHIDRPYLDVGFGLVFGWVAVVFYGVYGISNINRIWERDGALVVGIVAIVLGAIPTLLWIGSFAKQVKAGKFWQYTLTYRIALWMYRFARKIVVNVWGALPLAPKLVIRPFRTANDIYALEKGAKAIEQGAWDEKIEVVGGELRNVADSLNNIKGGIALAVEERTKSERMKTELITGVSHDIRTPLTSIITYTDLLKQEGLDSLQAPEYLDVLVQKSARLKALTDDLFEAAKAVSGNVEVNAVSLDLVALVRQVLGEMDSQLKSHGIELRTSLPEQLFVTADGKLMCRVMENLLSNVCKYSLAGSRAYLTVEEKDGKALVQLKNISAVELNLDPQELTERFKRGDASRTDGGSGLGLSIVQSFVTAQGGRFAITIDGDLFKVEVVL